MAFFAALSVVVLMTSGGGEACDLSGFEVLLQIGSGEGSGQTEVMGGTKISSSLATGIHTDGDADVDGCTSFVEECGLTIEDVVNMSCREKQLGFELCCVAGNYSEDLCRVNAKALFNESQIEKVDSKCSDSDFCSIVADLLDAHHVLQSTRLRAQQSSSPSPNPNPSVHNQMTDVATRPHPHNPSVVAEYLSRLDAMEVDRLLSSLGGGLQRAQSLLEAARTGEEPLDLNPCNCHPDAFCWTDMDCSSADLCPMSRERHPNRDLHPCGPRDPNWTNAWHSFAIAPVFLTPLIVVILGLSSFANLV